MVAVLTAETPLNNPIEKLIAALSAPEDYTPNKTAHPVFVGGIKYASLFNATYYSGISSVAIWKAIKKHDGGPAQVRKTFVVLEAWVTDRVKTIKENYQL